MRNKCDQEEGSWSADHATPPLVRPHHVPERGSEPYAVRHNARSSYDRNSIRFLSFFQELPGIMDPQGQSRQEVGYRSTQGHRGDHAQSQE